MATQHGVIQLQGTIGNITFFRQEDGSFGAKAKTSLSKERIASDPTFLRTRENNAEFGRAGKGGKVVRAAFQSLLARTDRRMVARLLKVMMLCIKADITSARGLRTVSSGNPLYLKGFEFNILGKLGTALQTPYTTTVNRTTGALGISVPAFVPATALSAPQGATHYKLVAAGAEIDFDNETHVSATAATGFLPIDNASTTPATLNVTVSTNSTLPIYQVLGIHFFQEVNGVKYAMNNGSYDAVQIVNADV